MANQARTFRIFVSSTFNDLKAERNALQENVFPRLRELCEKQKQVVHFQPIDLRWGVSDEAALDQQAMKICMSEILRCQKISPRPNFIILLGNRYGWRPLPYEILEEEYYRILPYIPDKDKSLVANWYQKDENAVPAVFFLQARNPELVSVPTREFERFVADSNISNEEREIAMRWYEPGQMKEPVSIRYFGEDSGEKVYILKALTGPEMNNQETERSRAIRIVEGFFWQGEKEIEPTLHAALEYAARKAFLSDREMIKYHIAATEQEIIKGAIQVVDAREHIFCFTREIKGIPPKEYARDFIDLDHSEPDLDAEEHLLDLKSRLKDVLGKNYHEYTATWEENGPSQEHINQFSQDVYDSLAGIIKQEVGKPIEDASPKRAAVHFRVDERLDAEGRAHQQFAEERLSFFVGRTEILSKIAFYLQNNERRSLAIIGEGGTGKSALMARAIKQTIQAYPKAGVAIVYRFIGATPASSDGRSLLDSLCREISRRYGVSEADIPLDFRDLVPEFAKRMGLATSEKPLILFLDSLDQLSAHQDARRLSWLPAELPEHVSLVVSSRKEKDVYQNLQAKGALEKILGGLDEGDGRLLLEQWLADVCRNLTAEQEQEVISKFMNSKGNPLYLKLAFEEARLWTSFEKEQEKLTIDVVGIIKENMINRLKDESNHGEMMVSHALGYLAASRQGLAEDELVDLLSRDLDVYEWFFHQTYHLPADLVNMAISHLKKHPEDAENLHPEAYHDQERLAIDWLKQDRTHPEPVRKFMREVLQKPDGPRLPIVLWSRLSFDLAPYLSERLVDGSALLAFYHRELEDVSKEIFLRDGKAQTFHAKLADYFRVKIDPAGDRSWNGGHKHGLSELPYHLISAGKRDEVFELLTDFTFLEHKAEEVGITRTKDEFGREAVTSEGVQDLQKDYDLALETFYGGSGSGIGGGPLIRTAEEIGGVLRVYCPVCNKKSIITRDQLGDVITCPQEECKARLKLNTFTIQMD